MGRPGPTKNGHDFYVVSSLLQKSLRRGDIVLAARAVNELLPKYANYAWNRLLTVSAEDCADMVTGEIMALYLAYSKWHDTHYKWEDREKGRFFFSKAIVLLAKAKHSRDADELTLLVSDRLPTEVFESALAVVESEILNGDAEVLEIPSWVYDVHTRQGKRSGQTREDFLRDEHAVMESTIFANFDEMVETWGYVDPEVVFESIDIEQEGDA